MKIYFLMWKYDDTGWGRGICENSKNLETFARREKRGWGSQNGLQFGNSLIKQVIFPGGSDGKESAYNVETWVWSLGPEVPLEKGMATHSSILAWRILWTEEPGGLQSMGLQRVGHDWATSTLALIREMRSYSDRWDFNGKAEQEAL